MPEEAQNIGLMAAIAPIARRRPVHIIISGAPDDKLNFVLAPKQMDPKEDPAIARGFAVTETPEVLDRELASAMARLVIPSHLSLQSVLDQAAAATETARQATLKKGTGTKNGTAAAKKDAGAGAPQISFDAAAAAPAASTAAPAAESPPPAAPQPQDPAPSPPPEAAAEPAEEPAEQGAAEGAADAGAEPALAVAADSVTTLFD